MALGPLLASILPLRGLVEAMHFWGERLQPDALLLVAA
jgi:hypothetical protein